MDSEWVEEREATNQQEKPRVLAADDEPISRRILVEILRKDYTVLAASDGFAALEKSQSFRPAVVLLDSMMPQLSGREVCRRLKSRTAPNPPQIIFVSGRAGTHDRLDGYAAGADDYLSKPFDPDELRAKVRVHVRLHSALVALDGYNARLEEKVKEKVEALLATRDITVFALASLAESRDPETGAPLERLREYAQALSVQLSREGPYRSQIDERFLSQMYLSSPLHDIGKVGIPDSILLKRDRLTEEEFSLMKQHTVIGATALTKAIERSSHADFLTMALEIALHHHEWFDGSGYPDGLRGLEIPLSARIVAVADVFDALTSVRCYRDALTVDVARAMILERSSNQFDPAIVCAFEQCFDEFQRIFDRLGERQREAVSA